MKTLVSKYKSNFISHFLVPVNYELRSYIIEYSRTETSACNRQIYHGNLTENSEPTDLRESRHRALTRQAIQGSVGDSHGSRFNGKCF